VKTWALPPFETLGVLWAAAWGAWVASPWWSTFSDLAIFSTMALIGPEWAWGGVPLLLAGLVVWTNWQGWQQVKHGLYGLLMAFFFFVSVAFFITNWTNTGGLTYSCLAVYYALLALRVGDWAQ